MPDRPLLCSALRISSDGRIALACGNTEIDYRGDDACPYGRQATRDLEPYSAIVLHHNPPYRSLDWLIMYQISGDASRGGHFGYHFYITQDGKIVQGAPLTVRTNHVKGSGFRVRKEFGRLAQNRNAIGITCVGAERPDGSEPTTEQMKTTTSLVQAICRDFNIPFTNVFGHGEVQSDRHPEEGTGIAELVRSWANRERQ
jgi:N-acetylmuramoyl-L-alanine amidase-like protein